MESFGLLQKKWRARLKAAGFEDIEDEAGNLKQPFPLYGKHNRQAALAACQDGRAEYFALARQVTQSPFFNQLLSGMASAEARRSYRKTWELHAEGVPYSRIAKLVGLSDRGAVGKRVRKIRALVLANRKLLADE